MKKKLEADLMSIAHRILQLKNKSDINQLYLETQKLYEKLAVLRFIDEHYGDVKPTIGHAEIEQEIQAFYDKNAELPVETVIEMTESELHHEEKTIEETPIQEITIPQIDKIVPEVKIPEAIAIDPFEAVITESSAPEGITAIKEVEIEKTIIEATPDAAKITEEIKSTSVQPEKVQISFEDLLGGNYNDPQFVKVDDVPPLPPKIVFEAIEKIEEIIPVTPPPVIQETIKADHKILSINDKLSKTLDIDLNDRIAFVKHLFGNNSEDYNRVVSQLITFNNFRETKDFIDEMVKPDYNNWEGKDDYADRFMDIIEKKFL